METTHHRTFDRRLAITASLLLFAAACGSGGSDAATDTTDIASAVTEASTETSIAEERADDTTTTTEADLDPSGTTTDDAAPLTASATCEATSALFTTKGSANPDLPDPEVSASCDGDTVVILTNAVPDFTYIETSPGQPGGRGEATYTIPATPVMADATTDVPYIGSIGVTLNGIPIFGPTEGTGGDVDSLPGIISACGSHNGPSGFHAHKILASAETDCFFTPDQVAEAPQLAGYAFDGYPIYTGIDQFTSSWQLTDESLFATDTWAAHTYVEGSGDLDECNGRFDENGDYAYYTTEAFPYVLGCFSGEVLLEGAGAGGDDAERPEQPGGEGEDAAERPERPERREGDDAERPERPEPPADGDDA